MPRGLARWFCRFLTASPILLIGTSFASSAEVVHLPDWEARAHLIKHRGPGQEYFELVALAEWQPKVTGNFAVRVDLPDGRTEFHPLPFDERPGGRRITFFVPAAAVRNLKPSEVKIQACVVDAVTGKPVSNVRTAEIEDFPRPIAEDSDEDPGPFGWGKPLSGGAGVALALPRSGPDDWQFVRVPSTPEVPAFFIAKSEASNGQVASRLKGYDPRAGRSDDFELEDPKQPAVGLTPDRAAAYLKALSAADPAHLPYRLPTRAEWLRAARAGSSKPFWWGDQPSFPAGANFHGNEPSLNAETTAPSVPDDAKGRYEPNPWGLFHTFGNVSEWAVAPSGGFLQMGGNFRTEAVTPLPELAVGKGDTTGSNIYVGVRPAFSLDAHAGAEIISKVLHADPSLSAVQATFDPDRATATLRGELPASTLRRLAETRLEPLWFLAAVENQIETPVYETNQVASLGNVVGAAKRIAPLGRWLYEVPIQVRWINPLPVSGSEWWVNVYLPGGSSFSHRLLEEKPGTSQRLIVLIDRAKMTAAGLPANAPVSVAVSLGGQAATPADPHVVSNVATLNWQLP
jgi:hypothetical protein